MKHLLAFVAMAASCAITLADDLPRKSIQIVSSADERTKVVLEQGDLLLVEIENGSGNFASDMEIDAGRSLKLVSSAMMRRTNSDGDALIGSNPIVLIFEATKAGPGNLTVTLDRRIDTEVFKLKIDVRGASGKNASRK